MQCTAFRLGCVLRCVVCLLIAFACFAGKRQVTYTLMQVVDESENAAPPLGRQEIRQWLEQAAAWAASRWAEMVSKMPDTEGAGEGVNDNGLRQDFADAEGEEVFMSVGEEELSAVLSPVVQALLNLVAFTHLALALVFLLATQARPGSVYHVVVVVCELVLLLPEVMYAMMSRMRASSVVWLGGVDVVVLLLLVVGLEVGGQATRRARKRKSE